MDVGFACAYLATPFRPADITGGTVYVDGGGERRWLSGDEPAWGGENSEKVPVVHAQGETTSSLDAAEPELRPSRSARRRLFCRSSAVWLWEREQRPRMCPRARR
jgi:hypothetical protein